MSQVRSKDGTPIAYERSGSGPALILIDGALCSRAFGPSPKLAPLLAQHFTVFAYDRRGRGQSGDTQPYSPAREVEDIAALIQEAGGSASLLGLSSGGALALQAAAADLAINKVVAYEPPYVDDAGQRGGDAYEGQLKRLVASGNRGGAVKYFMKDMVGVPAPFVVLMRLMPWIWRKLEAVAHTLPYDAALMTDFRIPRPRFASIKVPALVMNGSKTDPRLKEAARAIAEAIPGAQHSELAGQTHNVKPDVLTPAVVEFLTAPIARRRAGAEAHAVHHHAQDQRSVGGRRDSDAGVDCACGRHARPACEGRGLLAARGLRPSSEGVRLRFSAGTRSVINGPFESGNELPAAFSILRAGRSTTRSSGPRVRPKCWATLRSIFVP